MATLFCNTAPPPKVTPPGGIVVIDNEAARNRKPDKHSSIDA
jgi:hypothetical protein